jgi:hypothetical protein
MGNALVKSALRSVGPKRGKLSPAPPKGEEQEESKNVRKAKNAGNGLDEERGEKAAAALRTLMESGRISKDKALMKDVHAHAAAHMKSITEALSGSVQIKGKR